MGKWLAGVLSLLLCAVAFYLFWTYQSAVPRTAETVAGMHLTRYQSQATGGSLGVVIVAHGYASNKTMMWPWGDALARAGFDTYVIDQPGHGQSTDRLPPWTNPDSTVLGEKLVALIDQLIADGRAQPGRIALVGHSMGGAAVTQAALLDHRVTATVALSSAYAKPVPAGRPKNLLSLAADGDPAIITTAVKSIAAQSAGGSGGLAQRLGTFADGTARESDVVPGLNHITILYHQPTMERTADWLHASFGTQAPPVQLPGIPWHYLLLAVLGGMGVTLSVGARLAPARSHQQARGRSQRRLSILAALMTLALVPIAAALVSAFVRAPWLGIGVVDYLFPFFTVSAVVLAILRSPWLTGAPEGPVAGPEALPPAVARGLGLYAALAATVGVILHIGVSYAMPTLPRLLPLSIMTLCFWMLFVQEEQMKRQLATNRGHVVALLVGLFGRVAVVGVLFASAYLPNPHLFLPFTIPVALTLLITIELMAGALRRWGYTSVAIATFGALVSAGAMVVTFPLI